MFGDDFTRRRLLGGVALTGAAGLLSPIIASPAFAAGDPGALAEAAALWGYPLVQTGRYVELSRSHGIGVNQFHLNARLATPALKVAGPNVDTIYGFAWLDLSREPVVLDVPDTQDRYYSIQLIDAYENVFAYVGRRATGTSAGSYVIAPPGWSGHAPAGAKVISAPTTLVLALTRTLVRGEADAAVAAELQRRYSLSPLSGWPQAAKQGVIQDNVLNVLPALDLTGAGAGFFDALDRQVRAYPPTGPEAAAFERLAPLGLGTDRFAAYRPSDAVLTDALGRAVQRIRATNTSQQVNGWRVNYRIRPFIADPAERAAINMVGPGAHIAEEALYFSGRADQDGQSLSGQNRYTLTFPAGQLPPVDAFWSLILYDQSFFLVDNPIDRYTINDRTAGLTRAADGSLTIPIQNEPPADRSNWLPAPQGGFQLILRTYQPRPEVLDGRYKPPQVTRA